MDSSHSVEVSVESSQTNSQHLTELPTRMYVKIYAIINYNNYY